MSLDQFDGGFSPVMPGQRPGIEKLPDGEHVILVESASLTQTKTQRQDIVRWLIRTDSDMGTGAYEHVTFLATQQNANMLGADLMSLGIPADTWHAGNGKRFSTELPAALATLAGVSISVLKTTSNGANGKIYHNLRFLGRAGAQARMPVAGGADRSPEKMFDPANMPF